jgi:tripartite-type tricarboxylate transporter receptor subunit TctC
MKHLSASWRCWPRIAGRRRRRADLPRAPDHRRCMPYAPGSASDVLMAARMGEHFQRMLGQPVVLTNRDGGSGVVGMRYVAQSAPDGYTLGLTPDDGDRRAAAPGAQPRHRPGQFRGRSAARTRTSSAVVVRAESDDPRPAGPGGGGARTRTITFGSPGPNSLPQLAVVRIQNATGTEFSHIPFRGDPPHLNELLAGRLDFSSAVVAGRPAG